jgi:hypothetical protein
VFKIKENREWNKNWKRENIREGEEKEKVKTDQDEREAVKTTQKEK